MLVSEKCAIFALTLMFLGGRASAQTISILGTWTITTSTPAPWVKPGEAPLPSDEKDLIGHHIVFAKNTVTAPSPPLQPVCRKPQYKRSDFPPDYLFEGSLPDPENQAKALGFEGKTIPTIQTGCEGVTDFHFLNNNTALFGLNDRVYRIERNPAP
jgi:hypothetical protein